LESAFNAGEEDFLAFRRMGIPLIGETFDGLLNNIVASCNEKEQVYEAI
jgi:D-aminopeptidase